MTTTRTRLPLIGAGVSGAASARDAVDEALAAALPALEGETPDLGLVFASSHHADSYRDVLFWVIERATPRALIGCSAGGVIATGVELEDAPGVVVWLGRLPNVGIEPVRLRFRRDGDEGIIDGLGALGGGTSALLLLADPFTFPADLLARHLNVASAGVPIVGGMASGGFQPGTTKLFFMGEVLAEGAVGAVLSGAVTIATVVSQGCRPIGRPYAVTEADGNVLRGLDGEPALRRLEETYAKASERDQLLIRRGLHVGIAVRGQQDLGRGDFLVRNVVGADPETGALAITDAVEAGQVVQFHVRDADSAREDLRLLLDAGRLLEARRPAGALLFSCNGRGQNLFGEPHHDARALARTYGQLPVAGFFCQGELGPIGGRNFVHGFTASIALFLPPTSQ